MKLILPLKNKWKINPQSQHTCIYVPVGSSTQLKRVVFTLPRSSFTLTGKKRENRHCQERLCTVWGTNEMVRLTKFHLQSQGTLIITEICIWSQPEPVPGTTQGFGHIHWSPLTLWGYCLRCNQKSQGKLCLFPAFFPYFQFGAVLITSLSCDTTGTFSSVLYFLTFEVAPFLTFFIRY